MTSPVVVEQQNEKEKQIIRKVDEISESLNYFKQHVKLKEIKEKEKNAIICTLKMKVRVME